MRFNVRDMTAAAMFAALCAVCAQITVPLPAVPFTLQTFAVITAGLALKPGIAALAMTVYAAAGLAGVPVFAAFGGGLGYVFRPSFGFVLGFIPAAFVIGLIARRGGLLRVIAACAAGEIVIYAVGAPYMYFALNVFSGAETPWGAVFTMLLPFLPGDALKIIIAIPLALSVKRVVSVRRNTA